MRLFPGAVVSLCASLASASAAVQGSCASNTNTDISSRNALSWLESKLSSNAVISCRGAPLQLYNAGRYWGEQYGKNASVVVFPVTTQDVSYAVQAAAQAPCFSDFAFVGGAHGQTNASSAYGFIVDLRWLNSTQILHNVTVSDTKIPTAIAYEGGATWTGVNNVTSGSGYCAVGARVGNVGVGGFSTGGGIGFLAGAYGYAVDRLRAVEVVLMSGLIVTATKTNQHSDLFFALQGGGGQFGIVTKFYQEAAPEPTISQLTIWNVADTSLVEAKQNTVQWFDTNDDPFSLVYYANSFGPLNITSGPLGILTSLIGVRFGDPTNPNQKSFDERFAPLINGLELSSNASYAYPYTDLVEVLDSSFPYGYRRGFWGPQTTNITVDYLSQNSGEYDSYIAAQLERGDIPVSAVWAVQYMFPGLDGNLPTSDSATAWPHTVAGHQTLFSPAWNNATDDSFVTGVNDVFNNITRSHQKAQGPVIADYPNYISPDDTGSEVWGSNVPRLIDIKAKYDPLCRIHNGRVFATAACIRGGWANIYP